MSLRKNITSIRMNVEKKMHERSMESLGDINLLCFDLLDVIGQGAFGKVRIVEQLSSKKRFALKYIHKADCIKSKSTRNIFRERIILQQINHAFILNMRYAFQDEDFLYLVLDLALGGDMKYNIKHGNGFDNYTMMIYAAELSCALNYLHSNQIIHRDIKPENLILDERGHIYITDFNCSVSLKERTPDSQAGTLEYMAPEMFASRQYKFSVDWWSLGIVLFQCTYGYTPFKEFSSEKTIESICKTPLVLPQDNTRSDPCSDRDDFIIGLLQRNINNRIGCSNHGLGYSDLKEHVYFKNIDWNLLEAKKLGPTTIPKSSENYEKDLMKTERNKEGGDLLSQKFKSQKEKIESNGNQKQSLWLVSRVSSFISDAKKTTKSKAGSSDSLNITPTPVVSDVPKSREVIEAEVMVKYFHVFDFENCFNEPVILPPIWTPKVKKQDQPFTTQHSTVESNIHPIQKGLTRQKSKSENPKELSRPKTLTRQKTFENPSPLREAVRLNLDLENKELGITSNGQRQVEVIAQKERTKIK